MSAEFTKPITNFIVGEKAPAPSEAAGSGRVIPNKFGTLALDGFRVNPRDEESYVELDENTNPPVLHLHNALTGLLDGYTVSGGAFIPDGLKPVERTVSGYYTGLGSKLDIE